MGHIIGISYRTIKIIREVQDEPHILKYLTIIDPAIGWLDIVQYNDKQEDIIENLIYQAWLCRYPKPTIIKYNHGNEFLRRAFKNYLIERNT